MVAHLRAPGNPATIQSVNFSRDGAASVEQGLHRFTADRDYELLGVIATAGDAPIGDFLRFDVVLDAFDGGSSVYDHDADKPTIDDGANEGETGAPAVTSLPEGHYLTVDIVNVGSSVPGSKIDVRILYKELTP